MVVSVGMPVSVGHDQLSKTGDVERSGNPSIHSICYIIT